MSRPPVLDERTFRELVEEVFRRAGPAFENAPAGVTPWQPPRQWDHQQLVNPDLGTVLAALFARLLEIAVQRLNRVPEKNLLAFLDLMGVGLLPPSPARVPLTLSPAPGVGNVLAPQRTQVSGPEGVVFETERDLPITASQLVAAWTIDPIWDRFTDQTAAVAGQGPRELAPFEGNQPLPHVVYFANPDLLNFGQATHVQIRFPLKDSGLKATDLGILGRALRWSYWHEGHPRLLRSTANTDTKDSGIVVLDLEDNELAKKVASQHAQGSSGAPYLPIAGSAQRVTDGFVTKITAATGMAGLLMPTDGKLDGAKKQIPQTAGTSPYELSRATSSELRTAFQGELSFASLEKLFVSLEKLYEYAFVLPPLEPTDNFTVLAVDRLPLSGLGLSQSLETRWVAAELIEPLLGNEPVKNVRLEVWRKVLGDQIPQMQLHVESDLVSPDHIFTNATKVESGKHFQPFGPRPTTGDALYLGSEEVFGKDGAKVAIRLGQKPILHWQFWSSDDNAWKEFQPQVDGTKDAGNFTRAATVEFDRPRELVNAKETDIGANGVPERGKAWLRVTLARGNYLRPPVIVLSAAAKISVAAGTSTAGATSRKVHRIIRRWYGWSIPEELPEESVTDPQEFAIEYVSLTPVAYVNEEKVDDPAQPFGPFGPQPGPDTTLYIGFPLSDGVQRIIFSVGMAPPSARIIWEYGTPEGWVWMDVIDETDSFSQGGKVHLVSPKTGISRINVNGRLSRWVRARLVAGDYGRDAEYIPANPKNSAEGFKLRAGTGRVNPPTIYSLSLKYAVDGTPQVIRQTGAIFQLISSAGAKRAFLPTNDPELNPPEFDLPLGDEHPALYLGFDRPFDNMPVTFYVAAAPSAYKNGALRRRTPPLNDGRTREQLTPSAPLRWQYWNGRLWRDLFVTDETASFTKSGQITFVAPQDLASLARFNRTAAYWLRAQWRGRADELPTITGIYLNTVPAIQAVTVRDELVGSSNGHPSQVFKLRQPPILPGQQIWVREPEIPTSEERNLIAAEEGKNAIDIRTDPVTELAEVWVRWHEVATLGKSSARDRHYTLYRPVAELRFGDGRRGLVPPRGVDNIRAREYRSGGGAAGNQVAGAIQKLKNPPPTIAAATNPMAADGGADLETVPSVQVRGPFTLKHRNRAVSAEDFEWLARQASGTRVARAKCLPAINRNLQLEPGWTTVMIVPQGSGPKPEPSAELIREVEDHLKSLAYGGLSATSPAHINVIGPGYLQVIIYAEVVPTDLATAEQVRRSIIVAVDAFLHPLTGGLTRMGWPFGRNVYASEVAAVIECVPGVHHLRRLTLTPNALTHRMTLKDLQPKVDIPEGSLVTVQDGSKSGLLAEPLLAGSTVQSLPVMGFKEGDRITLGLDMQVRVRRQGEDPNALPVDPQLLPMTFPRNSIVMSADGATLTRLTEPIIGGREVGLLAVQDSTDSFHIGERITVFYPSTTSVRSFRQTPPESARILVAAPWRLDAAVTKDAHLRICTLDNSVRAPLADDLPESVRAVSIEPFVSDRSQVFLARADRSLLTDPFQLQEVTADTGVIHVEDNYLVYPGVHQIVMIGNDTPGS